MATITQPTHAHAGSALDNRRIAAAAIDLAPSALALIGLLAAGLLTPAVGLVLVGWTLYYFFALESGGGQTIGKRAMRLKVVSADGGEPTMQQYALRSIVRVVDIPMIGLLVMLATGDKRQRVGDIAAHTSVVDAETAVDPASIDAFDAAHHHANAFNPPEDEKPKRSRRSLGGPELKMPSFGRSKAPKQPKPAEAAQAPEAPEPPEPTKPGRRSLGGPELKMPSFGRAKGPEEPKPVKAAKTPKPAKSGRPSLGGPELKMPSFGRSKGPKPDKPAKAPKPAKSGRPTLGGPELKMPSFGRRKQKPAPPPPVAMPAPAVPEPEAVQPTPAPEPDPVPEVTPFDPFRENAPEPSVEVVSHDEPAPEPEEAREPEIMARQDVPEVEVMRPEPEQPPAPMPAPPAAPPPAAGRPVIPAIEPQSEAPGPEEPDPEPEHVEGVRDDGSSRVHVKPIETVSAMELLMRESENQDRQGS
jgi:uncharacterized RDD family membrane protein YckC